MLIEKLTLKDTFKIWRDKINALIDSVHQQPYTDDEGNYVINEKYTDATRVLMEIPLTVTTTVEAKTFIGELEGNASTATSLEHPRKINGTLFDGTDNITTSSWGESRSFKITDANGTNKGAEILIDGSNRSGYVLKLPSTIEANIDGNTTTAIALASPVQINGIKFDGTANVINYGVCETAANDAVKIVNLFSSSSEFILSNGATVTVKFLSKNTATTPLKLNVAATGAELIYAYGSPIDPDIIEAGAVLTFVFDGTNYNLTSLDKRVRQTEFSTNNEYPLLASPIVESTVTLKDDYTFFTKGITINPSKNSLKIAGAVTSNSLTTQTVTTPKLTSSSTLDIDSTKAMTINSKTTLSIASTDNLTISAKAVSITKGNLNISNALNVTGKTTLDTAYVNVLQTKYNNATINIIENGVVRNAIYNNDYAEFFPRGEETEAGDFVALSLDSDNEVYVRASKETSKSVGIHSDSFGHLIGGEDAPDGQDFVEYNLPKFIPVGLVGRVKAKIVGEIKKGDFVVISDIPGVGRKFDKEIDSCMDIIGMACESSTDKDIKRVKVKLGN